MTAIDLGVAALASALLLWGALRIVQANKEPEGNATYVREPKARMRFQRPTNYKG